jgi:hypothetical protein
MGSNLVLPSPRVARLLIKYLARIPRLGILSTIIPQPSRRYLAAIAGNHSGLGEFSTHDFRFVCCKTSTRLYPDIRRRGRRSKGRQSKKRRQLRRLKTNKLGRRLSFGEGVDAALCVDLLGPSCVILIQKNRRSGFIGILWVMHAFQI